MSRLVPIYRQMVADGKTFRGATVIDYTKDIGAMVRAHGARTVLDYGCGGGDQYRAPHRIHEAWGLPREAITAWDPAYSDEPAPTGQFDLVICSDVLEHVPEDEVEALIATLFDRARLAVWASVCCRPANAKLPDGRNAHVTLHPLAWWLAAFHAANRRGLPFRLVETP